MYCYVITRKTQCTVCYNIPNIQHNVLYIITVKTQLNLCYKILNIVYSMLLHTKLKLYVIKYQTCSVVLTYR